jgi:hypothetical protein
VPARARPNTRLILSWQGYIPLLDSLA